MEKIEKIAALYPRIMRVMGRIRSTLHEGMDLTYNQFKMLLTIYDRGCCPLTALAAELQIAMSSASEMVDRLVNLGLVRRTADAESRRRVIIQATEQGEALIVALQKGIIDNYRILLGKLEEEDQQQLINALETLVRVLGKLEGEKRPVAGTPERRNRR